MKKNDEHELVVKIDPGLFKNSIATKIPGSNGNLEDEYLNQTDQEDEIISVDGLTTLLIVLSIIVRFIPVALFGLILLIVDATEEGYYSSGFYYVALAIMTIFLLIYCYATFNTDKDFVKNFTIGFLVVDFLLLLYLITSLIFDDEPFFSSALTFGFSPFVFIVFQSYILKRLGDIPNEMKK